MVGAQETRADLRLLLRHRLGFETAPYSGTVLGGTIVTISHTRRAGVTVLLAGAAFLFAPVPAHAETVCYTAPNGARDCYDNGQGGGGIGGSNTGNAGSSGNGGSGTYGNVPPPPPPAQAPAPQPAPAPAPVYQAPAPVQAPAPAPKAPVNNYVAPKTGPGYQAPAPVLVPVPQYGPAVGADTVPAPAGAVPAEVPAEAAPAPTATIEATAVAATATATATPSPAASASPTPEPATVAADMASSAGAFNPAPLFVIGGVLLAAALVWFVRPVRGAVARVLPRKAGR